MAQLPKSFNEAFQTIRTQLVDHIHVSSSLLNRLLNSGLLNQRHVENLKVCLHLLSGIHTALLHFAALNAVVSNFAQHAAQYCAPLLSV